MRFRCLGCDGGIGGELRTTSFLVDDDVVIDCGTGVGELAAAELARVTDVFLTHAHVDHTGLNEDAPRSWPSRTRLRL